jgi:WD40 repeat protein
VFAQKQDHGFIVSEFDPVKGKGREIYRESHVEHLVFSPDAKWIADTSGSDSGTKIVLRSFSTGAVVREIPVRGVTKLTTLTCASDGKGFFVGDRSLAEDRELYVDLSGNTSVLWRQPGTAKSDSVILSVPSPDGKYLALVLLTDDSNVYMVENF